MRPFLPCGLALLSSCATVAVVDSGHAAVMLAPDGALSVLGEGATEVPGGTVVDDFDLRQQEVRGTFGAITSDGVPVVVAHPAVGYRWIADELIAADRTVGREGAQDLVAAVVGATTARVLATCRFDALDSAQIREVEAKVLERAAAQLRPRHLALESVELKGLNPRLPGLAKAVTATSIWEQRALTAQSGVELARQKADRLRAEAAGLAAANERVAPTLIPAVLQEKTDQAWRALLAAPNTTVEVSSSPSSTLEVSP
jgi:hypothetical protein